MEMQPIRTVHLIIAVVALTIVGEISLVLWLRGAQAPATGMIIGYVLIALNLGVGIAGLWTRHRMAWMAYLALSVVSTVLLGAVTPLSLIGLAAHVWW